METNTPKESTDLKKLFEDIYQDTFSKSRLAKSKTYKLSPKQLKERKLAELKEKRRRAKKITMTVGEFEDKLSEAQDYF